MIKNRIYRYLGTNGIVETPIRLEGAPYVTVYELIAEGRHVLTDGERQVPRIVVPQEDVELWHEIPLATDN